MEFLVRTQNSYLELGIRFVLDEKIPYSVMKLGILSRVLRKMSFLYKTLKNVFTEDQKKGLNNSQKNSEHDSEFHH